MGTEVREGLCYRRNPASQRTGKWKSHASGYSYFLACQPKMGIGSRLYASAVPSDDARCIWQICPFRSGSPCDLVALGEFWKSEKSSVRGTCSNMSMLHDYMVLRSKEKCKRGKADNAIYSLFHGSYEWLRYHSCSKYRDSDDVYCLMTGVTNTFPESKRSLADCFGRKSGSVSERKMPMDCFLSALRDFSCTAHFFYASFFGYVKIRWQREKHFHFAYRRLITWMI